MLLNDVHLITRQYDTVHVAILLFRRPFGVEEEYFVQLFFEINPQKKIIPFTEVLLWNMFKEQNISFAEVNAINTCGLVLEKIIS